MNLQTKYTPKTIDEIILDDKILDPIITFANSWLQGFPNMTRPGLLLYGKPGTGKTLTARCLCNDCDWSLVELNASSVRTKEQLKSLFKIPSYDFFGRRICLFLDEADSIEGGEVVIKKVITQLKFPVILTANDINKVSKSLRDVSESVQFFRPSINSLKQHLLKINREGLSLPIEIIDAAAKLQDYRAAYSILEMKQVIGKKEKKMSVADITKNLMVGELVEIPETNSEVDKKQRSSLIYHIDENSSKYYDILDLHEIFENLYKCDKYNRRGQILFSNISIKEIPRSTKEIEEIKYPIYYEKLKNSKKLGKTT